MGRNKTKRIYKETIATKNRWRIQWFLAKLQVTECDWARVFLRRKERDQQILPAKGSTDVEPKLKWEV